MTNNHSIQRRKEPQSWLGFKGTNRVMVLSFLVTALALDKPFSARAAIFDNTTSGSYSVNSLILPDGGALPIYNQQTISGYDYVLTDVNVMINVSGGYNGDLYGYLIHVDELGATTQVDLINRVGQNSGNPNPIINLFGYGDAGMHVLLDQSAANEIHTYQTVGGYDISSGTVAWNPDGGNLDAFNGMRANGTWTLFFADMSGGATSTFVSWGLAFEGTPIPEPTTWALIIAGAVFVAAQAVHHIRKRRKTTGGMRSNLA